MKSKYYEIATKLKQKTLKTLEKQKPQKTQTQKKQKKHFFAQGALA
jgi:hypothetical protein